MVKFYREPLGGFPNGSRGGRIPRWHFIPSDGMMMMMMIEGLRSLTRLSFKKRVKFDFKKEFIKAIVWWRKERPAWNGVRVRIFLWRYQTNRSIKGHFFMRLQRQGCQKWFLRQALVNCCVARWQGMSSKRCVLASQISTVQPAWYFGKSVFILG